MAGRMVDQGEVIALEALVNAKASENLVLRLFTNDVEDGLTNPQKEALTETAFVEADFTGYAPITLEGDGGGASNDWTSIPADPSRIEHPEVVFASTADQTPQTIFGWYMTTATGGKLVQYDYLNSQVTIQNDGDQIRVTPIITAQDTLD